MSSSSNFFLLIPAMYLLFTLALCTAALIDKRLVAARWAAAGFLVACVSILVDGYRVPGGNTWSSWFTVATHFIPLLIMIQAFLSRHGQNAPKLAWAVTLVGCVMVMPDAPWRPDYATRGWFVQATCATIIALGLPQLWTLRRRSPMDVVAFVVVLGAALSYGGRTFVMVLHPISNSAAGITEFYSGMNVVFHTASALMAMAVGITLLMAIGYDALRLKMREGEIDTLTGLGNRRLLARLIEEDAKGKRAVGAVLVIDIDHFKRINDTYGHTVGDQVLRAVGRQLDRHFSGYGTVCRFGGEEFVILIEEPHSRAVSVLALAARSVIAGIVFDAKNPDLTATASVGIGKRLAGMTIDEAIDHADKAVYSAKQAGRDQVHIALEGEDEVVLQAVA